MARKKLRSKHNLKAFIKEHQFVFFVAVIACIAFIISAGFVLYWFITTNTIIPQGSMTIDQLSMATLLWFIVNLVFWEALIVGLPAVIIFGVGGYLWWNGLSKKQKALFKDKDCEDKSNGGMGFFLFVAFVIYLFIDGTFFTPFGDLPLSYWLLSYLWTAVWTGILIGIPMLIIGGLWLLYVKHGKGS